MTNFSQIKTTNEYYDYSGDRHTGLAALPYRNIQIMQNSSIIRIIFIRLLTLLISNENCSSLFRNDGGVAINKKTNVDEQTYIKSRLNKIAKPTSLFALIYACYDVVVNAIKSSSFDIQMLEAIPKIIIAKPYHHLWYAYMIICMYLVVPNLISLLNQIGRHKFQYFSLMLMLLGMVMDYTCQLSWPVMFIKYLGYFCMGWTIKNLVDTDSKMRKKHFLECGLLILFFSIYRI